MLWGKIGTLARVARAPWIRCDLNLTLKGKEESETLRWDR